MIYPLSAFLGSRETYAATLLCCMDPMKTGTTTFADSFSIHVDAEAYAAACSAAVGSGIRAVTGRASLDQGEAPSWFKERLMQAAGVVSLSSKVAAQNEGPGLRRPGPSV